MVLKLGTCFGPSVLKVTRSGTQRGWPKGLTPNPKQGGLEPQNHMKTGRALCELSSDGWHHHSGTWGCFATITKEGASTCDDCGPNATMAVRMLCSEWDPA